MTGPWTALPHTFAEDIRRERRGLAAEIVGEIRRQIPEFGRPLAGKFGVGIQLGVETALGEFADLIDGAGPPDPDRVRIYHSLGRGELREGRSLDALQAAYRLGARVAWRRYARVARRTGLHSEQMVNLAEAVFAHIDMIASASALGYAEAKADEAGTLHRRRQRLLALLVDGAPVAQLDQAAAAAEWPLPDTVACAALAGPAVPHEPAAARTRRLPDGVLADLERPDAYLLIAEPDAALARDEVRDLLRGAGAVIGPAVPPRSAADSLRWARAVHRRLPPEALAGQKAPVLCDRDLPALLLLADEALVLLIGERRLGVLARLTAKQRRRSEETLLAWLETGRGSAPQVAARLGIHPQTARQRLHRLHDLFGPLLADSGVRFELEIALRGRRAFASFGPTGSGP
jgi:hypothetical protein